jgi:hypothetical protein
LLRNERVEAEASLEGHRRATLKRLACEPVVFMVQDTTFLESVKTIARHGFGTLPRTAKDEYVLPPSVAFTPERVNLGVLGHRFWQRPEEPVGHLREPRPIEAKESDRWLRGYEVAGQVQRYCLETLGINSADRAGAIQEWFLTATQRPAPERAAVIIRAKCNRRLACEPKDGDLWETLGQSPVCGTMPLALQSQPGRRARPATLSVRTRAVTFKRARRPGGMLPPVEVSTVYGKEDTPPTGEEALAWMLLTNLPVEDFATAQAVINGYRARGDMEWYCRILQPGCRVEDLRVETPERLEKCLAVSRIVAWRIHHITQAAREHPTVPCTNVVGEQAWQTMYLLQTQQRPPKHPPTLRVIPRMLAQLGGFLARRGDGEPGAETVGRGYTESAGNCESRASMSCV